MRMRKIPLTWILTLIVGSAVIICQAVDLKTLSCDTDAIAKLQEGNVTCSFPMDLLGDFIISISYYTETSDKLVMECRWDKIPDQCNFLRAPYKVVKVSGRAIKLKVSNISVPHLSAYRCSLWDGTYMFHSPFCAMLIHPDSYAVTSGGQTTTAAHLDQPSKRQDSEEGLSGGVVAGYVTCAVIIVVLTALVVVLSYRELRRRTQATKPPTIEDPNAENERQPILPVGSADDQNRPSRENEAEAGTSEGSNEGGAEKPMLPENSEDGQDRPRQENEAEAGTSEGSNEGGAEKPMLPENSEDGQDRRGTQATNSPTIEEPSEDSAEPMLPVNSKDGPNRPFKIPPEVPPKPSRDKLTEAGTRKGSNTSDAEKPPVNSEDGLDRKKQE